MNKEDLRALVRRCSGREQVLDLLPCVLFLCIEMLRRGVDQRATLTCFFQRRIRRERKKGGRRRGGRAETKTEEEKKKEGLSTLHLLEI